MSLCNVVLSCPFRGSLSKIFLFFKRCLYELFACGWSAVTYLDMLYNCAAIPRRSKKCYKCSAQLSVGFTAAVVAAGAAAAVRRKGTTLWQLEEKEMSVTRTTISTIPFHLPSKQNP